MAINVSGLTAYVDQNRLPLISKSVADAKSAQMLTLQTGVKDSAALNLIDTTVTFGDGSTCGFSAAGDDKLSQRVLKVGHIKVNKEYCDKTLEKYWAGYLVKTAATGKQLPFEEEFMKGVADGIKSNIEKAIWQGDTTSSDANLNKFDGFIKIVSGATGVVDAASATTASELIMNVYKALPSKIVSKEDTVIFVGEDLYRDYVAALVEKNLYHYDASYAGGEIKIPGTNISVVAVEGLNGTDKVYGARKSNMFYGTDLENDEEVFDLWFSQDNRTFRLAVEFNAGVQIAYPDEIVYGVLS